MSVITGQSRFTGKLLDMLGVPKDAIAVEIRIEPREPIIVACEFFPDEVEFDEEVMLVTEGKEYFLMEREDDGD